MLSLKNLSRFCEKMLQFDKFQIQKVTFCAPLSKESVSQQRNFDEFQIFVNNFEIVRMLDMKK